MKKVEELKPEVIHEMAKRGIIRNKHVQIDTLVNHAFQSHNQGNAKQAIDELITDTDAPIRRYRQNTIRLTNAQDAREYLEKHDKDIPWRLRD